MVVANHSRTNHSNYVATQEKFQGNLVITLSQLGAKTKIPCYSSLALRHCKAGWGLGMFVHKGFKKHFIISNRS